jgi:hypothetical protein
MAHTSTPMKYEELLDIVLVVLAGNKEGIAVM